LSKPEGIYLSVDYRVTGKQLTGGQEQAMVLDHAAVKHLRVDYPAHHADPNQWSSEIGPAVLFAYTGLAEYGPRWSRTKIGDWLRETIRGESDSLQASLEHLKNRLNRDLAKFREGLIVGALVIDANGATSSRYPIIRTPTSLRDQDDGAGPNIRLRRRIGGRSRPTPWAPGSI
jgi:hypothetical protein